MSDLGNPNGWTSTEVVTDTVDDGGLGVDLGLATPGKFNSEASEKFSGNGPQKGGSS